MNGRKDGRTARKHNAFSDTVGWQRHKKIIKTEYDRIAEKSGQSYVIQIERSTILTAPCNIHSKNRAD